MSIQNNEQYKFFYGTKNQLDRLKSLGLLNQNNLYYLTDKQQIYVGENLYGSEFIVVDEFPSEPKINTLYIHKDTKEIRIFENNEYKVICLPVVDNLDVDYSLATSKAIRDYIKNTSDKSITGVKYRVESQSLNLQYGDGSIEDILLKDILTNVEYNSQTGDFIFSRANGEDISVNTPKENFLSDVSYDPYKNTITFKMVNGSTFDVDLTDLIEIYTTEDTASIDMNISENKIFANIKVSDNDGNRVQIDNKGLYVPDTDLSNYYTSDKIEDRISEVVNPLQREVDRLEIDKQNNLVPGYGIRIDNNVISSILQSVEWGSIQGNILDQEDLQEQFSNLESTIESNISTTEGQLQGKIDNLQQQTTQQIGDLTTNLSTQIQEVQVNLENTQQELSKEISDTKTEIENTIQPKLDELDQELDTKQDVLTSANAGDGISIVNGVISNTRVSAEWGNIQGDITSQTDLQNSLSEKLDKSNVISKGNETTPVYFDSTGTAQPITSYSGNSNSATKALQDSEGNTINTFYLPITEASNTYAVKSTTLDGYNIGDAYTKTEVDELISSASPNIEVDDKTITKNSEEKIQTIGVLDVSDSTTAIQTWTGTKAEYDQLTTKLDTVIYHITDEDGTDGTTIMYNSLDELEVIGEKTVNNVIKKTWVGTNSNYNEDIQSGIITDTTECLITDDEQEILLSIDTYTKDEIDDKIRSSYYVGQTIFSLDPLNHASLRLLDGSLLQVGGIYDEFISKYIDPLFKKHPNRFISESEWQQQVSTYGVCGKYVYTEGVAVRLPKVTGIVEGTIDPSALGDLVEAGLPNITGNIRSYERGWIPTGAFYIEDTRNEAPASGSNTNMDWIKFDASRSSSIYGNSATVQPQTIKGYYYIVVATGIDEEVNLKFDSLDVDYARSDLSNLTHEGERHFVGKGNITNCLLEVPQNIKLELNNGTLTLKAGSELTYGDGRTIKIENDLSGTCGVNATINNLILICEPQGNSLGIYIQGSNATSGTTPPPIATGTVDYIWFDTSTNQIKISHDTQATWKEIPLPIGVVDITPYTYTNINQVFNGMGYIGSTIWVDKGVKGLIPNGRNEDGTLRNIEINKSELSIFSTSNFGANIDYQMLVSSSSSAGATRSIGVCKVLPTTVPDIYTWVVYNEEDNFCYRTSGSTTANWIKDLEFAVGKVRVNSDKNVSFFEPKQPFRAVDYNDKSEISGWAMPSTKYINLTLGAVGTTYTAPANGWYFLDRTANAGGYVSLSNNTANFSSSHIAHANGNNIQVLIPVSKGDVISIAYNSCTATTAFRFIYAQGEEI